VLQESGQQQKHRIRRKARRTRRKTKYKRFSIGPHLYRKGHLGLAVGIKVGILFLYKKYNRYYFIIYMKLLRINRILEIMTFGFISRI